MPETKTKHHKQPYFLSVNEHGYILHNEARECIAKIPTEARATFILLAVNSHEKLTKQRDQLLVACKLALGEMEGQFSLGMTGYKLKLRDTIEVLHAAEAAAEGTE